MSYRKELTFGLDIGDQSLKALQFRASRGKTRLEGFSELEIPADLLQKGEILNPDQLAAHIKKAIHQAGITAQHVITALPESKTFLKLLHLPIQETIPLEKQLEDELQKHLPYEISEIWWDYALIKKTATKLQVLVGAAPQKLVNSYTETLAQAGLTAVALDIEPLSIARALINPAPFNDKKGGMICSMIVDLGATKSTLIMANPETVLFTADGRSSSNTLTNTIADNLRITSDKAEKMKCQNGLKDGPTQYLSIVQNYTTQLAKRIKETISFSNTSELEEHPAVSEILLVGGGALLKGLPEAITATLKIPARLANPWTNTKDTIGLKIAPELGLRLATACGLALTSLEFDHSN